MVMVELCSDEGMMQGTWMLELERVRWSEIYGGMYISIPAGFSSILVQGRGELPL